MALKVKTKLGFFDIDEKEIISFPNGLPGFEKLRKFCLVSRADTEPVKWLVSIEDENIALPVVDPWLIMEDYSFDLDEESFEDLGRPDKDKTLVLVVMNLHSEDVSANMAAPIVVNLEKGIGEQVILENGKYSVKYPIGTRK